MRIITKLDANNYYFDFFNKKKQNQRKSHPEKKNIKKKDVIVSLTKQKSGNSEIKLNHEESLVLANKVKNNITKSKREAIMSQGNFKTHIPSSSPIARVCNKYKA
jgi:hypothetical protein